MSKGSTSNSRPLANAAIGAIGAVCAGTLIFPLTLAKTRIQVTKTRRRPVASSSRVTSAPRTFAPTTPSAWHIIVNVIRKEGGFLALYVGLKPAIIKEAIKNFIFFFAYSALATPFEQLTSLSRHFLLRRREHRKQAKTDGVISLILPVLVNVLHGMAAGIIVQFCQLPLDIVVTRMVTQRQRLRKGEKYNKVREVSVFRIVQEIYNEDGGIVNFWSGLGPGLSLTLNPGITMAVNATLSTILLRRRQRLSPGENFVVGLLSKLIASTTTYPAVVLLKAVQYGETNPTEKQFCGKDPSMLHAKSSPSELYRTSGKNGIKLERSSGRVLKVLTRLIHEEGWSGLYKGLGPQLIHASIKEALLNAIRQHLKVTLIFNARK